jgi:cytochrome b561
MKRSDATAYTRTSIFLHWIVAVLIFSAFPLGVYMHGMPLTPDKLRYFSYHKWMGVTVFALALIRIIWRLTHTPPEMDAGLSRWERIAARCVHDILYVFIVAIPLSGWLMSSATGLQTVWFGVLPIPDLIDRDRELGDFLLFVHQTLNWALLALVLGHAIAALNHHFFDRDETLVRMIPLLRSRGTGDSKT